MPKNQTVIRGVHSEARSDDGKAFLLCLIEEGQSYIAGSADGIDVARSMVATVDLAYRRALEKVLSVLDGRGGHQELDRLRALIKQPLFTPTVEVVPKEAPVE